MARKMAKGQFDLNDLSDQLTQMKRMGGMSGIMGLLPGVQKVKKQIEESNISDKTFDRQVAIISSMTKIRTQEARPAQRVAQAPHRPPAPVSMSRKSTAC